MYKRLKNPAQIDVSRIIFDGYMLHSVTPVYNQSQTGFGKTDLIYHFIKNPEDICESPEIKLNFSEQFPLKN